MAANPERNTDAILAVLRDYLAVREQQTARTNPRIAGVIGDIIWSQVENTRNVLNKAKAIGPEKFRVSDMMIGEDDQKRKNLFSMTDQNSLASELMNKDDQGARKVAELAIHDMRSLYRSIDPSLENVVQLIQHWIWWDLPDAADMVHFDDQARRIETLLSIEISDELRTRYRAALKRADSEELSDTEIFGVELKRLEFILQRVILRRSEEEAFQMIIRRDEASGGGANGEILRVARHVEALSEAEGPREEGLGDEDSNRYAALLSIPASEVTLDRIADYERRAIADGKMSLKAALADDRSLGPPYDYKKRQVAGLLSRVDGLKRQIEGRAISPAQRVG